METILTKTYVEVPGAPAIPGLRFRLFQGDADFPEMVAAINAAKLADKSERADTAEDMRKNYSHLVNCNPYRDVLIAEVDGRVVGYSRITWNIDENEHKRIYQSFGFICPEWRRQGIGRAMLHHNQAALRAIAAGHPRDLERSFESFGQDTEIGNDALMQQEGYIPVRYGFSMVRPDLEAIPDLPLPGGLDVRPVRPEDWRTIWNADQEAFRDHWGFAVGTEEDYTSWCESRNHQPELWQVAWAGDEVAGAVQNYIDHNENAEYHRLRGYTEGIFTRRPWRKRGLAHALIARSLRMLMEKGMQDAGLGVDSQNLSGALHVYESMGFTMVKRFTTYRKKMED
jgi:ribosomal protein S18 acetylase RimI-like enzyme